MWRLDLLRCATSVNGSCPRLEYHVLISGSCGLPTCCEGLAGEDVFAYENFFAHQRNGVFLELGALDGYSYSNTLLFEHFMGWCRPTSTLSAPLLPAPLRDSTFRCYNTPRLLCERANLYI